MSRFSTKYQQFIELSQATEPSSGFCLKRLEQIEPLLSFLYEEWWKVNLDHIERLPKNGPALIVGNSAGLIPWPALMLLYRLMSYEPAPRRITILADMDWVTDTNVRKTLTEIGFVPWSSENMKALFQAGALVVIFPEGVPGMNRPFSERYRLRDFDWTRLLPAIEEGIHVHPMATLGCDEAIPNLFPMEGFKQLLRLPSFNVTPFFPWLPFPLNFASFPIKWSIQIGRHTNYKTTKNRDDLEELAKQHTRFIQGEIQAELNRMLRKRSKSYV
jgi:1-acyl-sn-glycerol-3-phosphate acyltransferase